MKIQAMEYSDLDRIKYLQPPGWNDIRTVFSRFIGRPFFLALKIEAKDKIIAIGQAILNGNTAWLGNIIVHQDHRRKGLGRKMTQELINKLNHNGIKSYYLLATESGKALYESFGFIHMSKYVFLKQLDVKYMDAPQDQNHIVFDQKFTADVLKLDKLAIGEDRSKVLKDYLQDAILYTEKDQVSGFYLPKLGDGLIISKSFEAGLYLSQLRLNSGKNILTLPKQNMSMINWAKDQGYTPYRKAYKMYIGKKKPWTPELIFNRIGGYLG